MNARTAHDVWTEQCEAAQMIRARFGLKAALDYLVGEKLTIFVSPVSRPLDFTRDLPGFISEIRHMFTLDKNFVHLAKWNMRRIKKFWTFRKKMIRFVRVRLQPWNTPTVHDKQGITDHGEAQYLLII
jgi:hypothetical protein